MKRYVTYIFAVISGVLLIAVLLTVSIEAFALNEGFFVSEYRKLGTAEKIGISDAGLETATRALIEYTKGEREDLAITAEIGGETREVFNRREKDHMVDVRGLYLMARDVRNHALIAIAVLTALGFLLSRTRAVQFILKSYLKVCMVFLALLLMLAAWILINFSSFWVTFHHVFFTNELWILDPETDILINMVPQPFFFDLVIRIAILFAGLFIASMLLGCVGLKLYKKFAKPPNVERIVDKR